MSGPFKKEVEPLVAQLLKLNKHSVKLIASQPYGPEEVYPQQEDDQERLTPQEYQINAETFLKRMRGVITRMRKVNTEWKAYIQSRTPAEAQKTSEDYVTFLVQDGDENVHFTTLIEEGEYVVVSVEQSLTVLRINHAQIQQTQVQPAVQGVQHAAQQPQAQVQPAVVQNAEQPQAQVQPAVQEVQNEHQLPQAAIPVMQPGLQRQAARQQPDDEDFAVNLMSLKDTAEKAIRGYNITNDNYPIVVELLKRRFGNRQAIAEMLQTELLALPKATDAIQSLRSLSESIERICRQMTSMRLSDEQSIIVTAIKSKLPYSVMTKLVERERAEGGNWTTAKLRKEIQEIIAVREDVQRSTGMVKISPPCSQRDTPQNSRQKNDGQRNQEITRSFPVTSNDKKQPIQKRPKIQPNFKTRTPGSKCYLCEKGLHWARDCTVSTVEQRKKKLTELQRFIVNTATEESNIEDSIVATSVSTQPSEVLLMAKETKISSTQDPRNASQGLIFFDTGSQTSFIRIEVAKQLRLKKLEESELEVHGFSQQPIRFQSPKYAVRIHLQNGRSIDLILNGTAKISSSFTTTTVSGVKNHPILGKVANILSKQRSEPDLLIGMGDFWQFLQRVEEITKDLYMVHTTIGPILCGRSHLPSGNRQRTISNMAIGSSNVEAMPERNEVQDFWSLEAIGVHDNPEDNDDQKAMELFQKSVHQVNAEPNDEVITSITNMVIVPITERLIDYERFSKWLKLVRTTAYALRFIRKSARKIALKMDMSLPSEGSLSPEELEAATYVLLLNHQKNVVIPLEKISNWQLIKGPDGLLRVNSRLGNADLPANTKKPIFLHPKEHFTRLVVLHLHSRSHHSGVDSTLAKLLANYWTLHARKQVRLALNSCFTCRKTRAKQFSLPQMPDLPVTRVSQERSQRDHKGPHLQNNRAPELNEIVLIEDDLQPRNIWRLGKIVELPTIGPIRTAKVLTANKHILTRPINRLYSLEIPLAEKSRDTQSDTDTPGNSPEQLVRQPKAVATEITSVDKSPSKAAIVPKHGFQLRDRAKLKPPARTLLATLALLCLTAISGQPFKKCPSCDFSCTPEGVRLQTPAFITKAEICCRNYDCKEVHRLNDFSLELPQSLRANTHSCRAQVWGRRKYHRREIECPAIDICELTDCYLCVQRLLNPECRPNFSAIITGIGIVALLFVVCLILKIISIIAYFLVSCGKCTRYIGSIFCRCCRKSERKSRTRLSTSSDEEDELLSSRKKPKMGYKPFRMRPFSLPGGRVIKLITILTLVSISPPQTQQCAEVISFSAKEEKCEILKNETRCMISDASELTLLPAGQEVCLFLKDSKGNQMGTLKLKLDHISVHCIPRTETVTRSYAMKVAPRHHCPTVGSCSGDYCTRVNTETDIPELSEYHHYPGHSYCHDSCSMWDCTPACGLPTTSCLFYRTYAYPLTDIVYEVFTCPDWRYGIKVDLQLEVNQQVETTELTLMEGLVTHWKNISISPLIVTQPPAPVFGRHFITDGTSVAMITSFASDLHCANASAAKEFKCSIRQEACTDCTDVGQIIHCKCKDLPIEDMIENPEYRLPLMVGRYEVKNSAKDVFVESHHNPIRLFTKVESLKVVAATDGSTCTVIPVNLTGCYRCDTGGELTFECSTDFGSALATISCGENLIFTQACTTNLSQYTTVLHFETSDIDTNCTVECPGSQTEFGLKGKLRYIPISEQVGYEEISKEDTNQAKPTCILCDIEIPQLFEFVNTWSIIIIVAAFAISTMILICIIRLNPAFRLWKLSYRLIASYAMIFILFRLDQSAANIRSFSQSAEGLASFGQSEKKPTSISQSAINWSLIKQNQSYISLGNKKKNHSCIFSHFEGNMDPSSLIQVLLKKTEMSEIAALSEHLRCLSTVDRSRLVCWLLDHHLLETTHLRVNRRVNACDITSVGALNLKPFGRPRYSVATYFSEKHQPLEHPSLQCVVENGGYRKNGIPHRTYFPLEVIKIVTTQINGLCKPPDIEFRMEWPIPPFLEHRSAFRPIVGNTSTNRQVMPNSEQAPTVPDSQAPTVPNIRPNQGYESESDYSISSVDTDTPLSKVPSPGMARNAIRFVHAQLDFKNNHPLSPNGSGFDVTVILTVGLNSIQNICDRRVILEEVRVQLETASLSIYTPLSQSTVKNETLRCYERAEKVRQHIRRSLYSMRFRLDSSYLCSCVPHNRSVAETLSLTDTRCTNTLCKTHEKPMLPASTSTTSTHRVPLPVVTRRNTGGRLRNLLSNVSILAMMLIMLPTVRAESHSNLGSRLGLPLITLSLGLIFTLGTDPATRLQNIYQAYSRPSLKCKICLEFGHVALDCEEERHKRLSGFDNDLWKRKTIACSKLDRLPKRNFLKFQKENQTTNQRSKKQQQMMSLHESRPQFHWLLESSSMTQRKNLKFKRHISKEFKQTLPLLSTPQAGTASSSPMSISGPEIMEQLNEMINDYHGTEQPVTESPQSESSGTQPRKLQQGSSGTQPSKAPLSSGQPAQKNTPGQVFRAIKPTIPGRTEQDQRPVGSPQKPSAPRSEQEAPTRKQLAPRRPQAPRRLAPTPEERPARPESRPPRPEKRGRDETPEEVILEAGESDEEEKFTPSPEWKEYARKLFFENKNNSKKLKSMVVKPHAYEEHQLPEKHPRADESYQQRLTRPYWDRDQPSTSTARPQCSEMPRIPKKKKEYGSARTNVAH
ncbi:phlebovirus glycoprotein g2 domain-containing protein [Ditylenchus destructor]|uniref:Envelopment polyprotein n=1 Tax=Ditylenchus destructor TaxID=166010 RepID=A0AAD4N9Q1_9BILA|nr:phlebovirus glycoprotein g2 domain-containing protein [Ditylenchus destructor]